MPAKQQAIYDALFGADGGFTVNRLA